MKLEPHRVVGTDFDTANELDLAIVDAVKRLAQAIGIAHQTRKRNCHISDQGISAIVQRCNAIDCFFVVLAIAVVVGHGFACYLYRLPLRDKLLDFAVEKFELRVSV